MNTRFALLIFLLGLLAAPATAATQQRVVKAELVHMGDEIDVEDVYVTQSYADTRHRAGKYTYRVMDDGQTTLQIGNFRFGPQLIVEGRGTVNATGVSTTLILPYSEEQEEVVLYRNGIEQARFDIPHPQQPEQVYLSVGGQASATGSSSWLWPMILTVTIILGAGILVLSLKPEG